MLCLSEFSGGILLVPAPVANRQLEPTLAGDGHLPSNQEDEFATLSATGTRLVNPKCAKVNSTVPRALIYITSINFAWECPANS